jgi:hypothetical protein
VISTAVGQLVAIHRSDYHVAQFQLSRRFGNLIGLVEELFDEHASTGFDRTKATAPRAHVPEDHEGRSASGETVVAIWAARFFADSVKASRAQHLFEVMVGFDVALRLTKPLGKSRPWLWSFELNEHGGPVSSP